MSAVSIIGIQTSGLCASSHSSVTGPERPPSCVRLMLSSPPATMQSASPAMMRCAAIAIVCRPEEQKRFTVTPDTVTGMPARMAESRAILLPVAFSGVAQPSITSSTSPGSIPARSTACFTTSPPRVAPCVMLKAPRNALPIGVRAVETMTASGITRSSFVSARPHESGDPVLQPWIPACAGMSREWVTLRGFRFAVFGKRAALVGKFIEQRGRIVALFACFFRELAQPVADLLQAHRVGPMHRTAAPGRKAVAVEPDHGDVARARRDPFFQDARAFVDHRIDQPLDDLFLRDVATLHAHAHRGVDNQLLDFGVGPRRTALINVESLAGLLSEAALFGQRIGDLIA